MTGLYDLAKVELALVAGIQARRLLATTWRVTSSPALERGPYTVHGDVERLVCTCRGGYRGRCRHVAPVRVLLAKGAVPVPSADAHCDADLAVWNETMSRKERGFAAYMGWEHPEDEPLPRPRLSIV
jgi:hypothetical protein